MKDIEVDSESSESEIDENDPLAPQLHYIRRQKQLEREKKRSNKWVIKALKMGPCLRKIETFGKYLLILGVLGVLLYLSSDKLTEFNK
ncbi:unnamed protein product [Moneuplotes crassus]|uniref:Uncharacterized protein n=1 Tax=Euplotes crassus TaxID=5936 RepID=A0AAD1XLI9_EUPCR|nr:unnamed protein product [Moneuplotes crassus]